MLTPPQSMSSVLSIYKSGKARYELHDSTWVCQYPATESRGEEALVMSYYLYHNIAERKVAADGMLKSSKQALASPYNCIGHYLMTYENLKPSTVYSIIDIGWDLTVVWKFECINNKITIHSSQLLSTDMSFASIVNKRLQNSDPNSITLLLQNSNASKEILKTLQEGREMIDMVDDLLSLLVMDGHLDSIWQSCKLSDLNEVKAIIEKQIAPYVGQNSIIIGVGSGLLQQPDTLHRVYAPFQGALLAKGKPSSIEQAKVQLKTYTSTGEEILLDIDRDGLELYIQHQGLIEVQAQSSISERKEIRLPSINGGTINKFFITQDDTGSIITSTESGNDVLTPLFDYNG